MDWFTNELDIVHVAEMVLDGFGQSEGDVQSMAVDPKNELAVGSGFQAHRD